VTLLRPPAFVREVDKLVEVSRRHGPFDTRWPCIRSSGAVRTATLRAEELAEALDWDAFSARHFGKPGRRDSEARSAYAAYRQGREWRTTSPARPAGLSLVPPEPASDATTVEAEPEGTGARRLLAALAVVNPRAAQVGLPTDPM
jgi:hypothetical protein